MLSNVCIGRAFNFPYSKSSFCTLMYLLRVIFFLRLEICFGIVLMMLDFLLNLSEAVEKVGDAGRAESNEMA